VERFAPLLGICVLLGAGYVFSTSRRNIPWRLVIVGVLLQVYLALFIVRDAWVPVMLTVAAGACALILAASLLRKLPGYWTPAARGLGLLGWITTFLHLTLWLDQLWFLLGLTIFPFVKGRARLAVACAGCVLVLACIWMWELPSDFVFGAVDGMGTGVMWVVGFAKRGAGHVFGPLMGHGFVFAIEVGSIILLFGGLMSFLYHIGLIPWLVGLMARVLYSALGVSGAESLSAASNVFVGQTEAPLIVRPYLNRMTDSEIMTLMAGGFATIAGSVLGLYVSMLQNVGFERGAADLIAASVMSAPAAIVFAKLLVPETGTPATGGGVDLVPEKIGANALDALTGGVTAGLKLAVNVVAMLLVFYGLIYMLNDAVEWAAKPFADPGETITFQGLYARLFAPFAWLLGVPWEDCIQVGELLGTKTLFNEFIAYERLAEFIDKGQIQERSAVLATYALCGFANFMSIGIQIGGLSQLAPEKRSTFSRLALRAMIAGAMACQLTACIVALIGEF